MPEPKLSDYDGILHESGDRWKLDTLIAESQRVLARAQQERTSKLRTSTIPVLVTGTLNPERATHKPIHSCSESALDEQRRLRKRYSSDEPLEGDILL